METNELGYGFTINETLTRWLRKGLNPLPESYKVLSVWKDNIYIDNILVDGNKDIESLGKDDIDATARLDIFKFLYQLLKELILTQYINTQ
jgi:hypothetical protein